MIRRILTLMWKEFIELRQNPRLFGLIIVAPIVQLTMLGYAATTDVKNVPIVVVDGDRSPISRQLQCCDEVGHQIFDPDRLGCGVHPAWSHHNRKLLDQ